MLRNATNGNTATLAAVAIARAAWRLLVRSKNNTNSGSEYSGPLNFRFHNTPALAPRTSPAAPEDWVAAHSPIELHSSSSESGRGQNAAFRNTSSISAQ